MPSSLNDPMDKSVGLIEWLDQKLTVVIKFGEFS